MKFQTLKIGQNLHPNMEGFQGDSYIYVANHIVIYLHYTYYKSKHTRIIKFKKVVVSD